MKMFIGKQQSNKNSGTFKNYWSIFLQNVKVMKSKKKKLRNSSWLKETRELFQLHAMNDPGLHSRSIMAIVRPISKI